MLRSIPDISIGTLFIPFAYGVPPFHPDPCIIPWFHANSVYFFLVYIPTLYIVKLFYPDPVRQPVFSTPSCSSFLVFILILYIIPCFVPLPYTDPCFQPNPPSSTRVFIPILYIVPCFHSDLIHHSIVVASTNVSIQVPTSSRVFIPILFITLVFILIKNIIPCFAPLPYIIHVSSRYRESTRFPTFLLHAPLYIPCFYPDPVHHPVFSRLHFLSVGSRICKVRLS